MSKAVFEINGDKYSEIEINHTTSCKKWDNMFIDVQAIDKNGITITDIDVIQILFDNEEFYNNITDWFITNHVLS